MKYTCPKADCSFTSIEHDNIREILEHEKTHPKEAVTQGFCIDRETCSHCDGKGYTESKHMVDIPNVPKTD